MPLETLTDKPAILHFAFTKEFVKKGEPTTVRWQVENATELYLLYNGQKKRCTGSKEWTFQYDTVQECELLAVNPGINENVSAKANCTIVHTIKVNTLDVKPRSLPATGIATLQWDVTGATDIFLLPDKVKLPPSGTLALSPRFSCEYTFEMRNSRDVKYENFFIHVQQMPEIGPLTLPVMPALNTIDDGLSKLLNLMLSDVAGPNKDNLENSIFTSYQSPFDADIFG